MKVLLGDLVNIKTGKLDANQADENGKYPFFTCSKEISKINSYSYDCECVLVAGNGDLNVKYHNGKFEAYQRTYILTSTDVNTLSNKYIYWFMNRYIVQLRNQSIGGVIKYIKLGDLTNISLNLPTLDVQKRIVGIFESIERLISKKVFILKGLDDLIKSRFDELFLNTHSIETMEIGELFEVGSSKRILQSELTTYGIPFYRVTDLINRINDRPVDIKQYVDELKYMTLIKEKYVPQAGDFLITARGTIGKIYEVKQNDKFYFQDGMITWLKRKNNYINNLFFMELVKTDWFRRQFYSSNNGTTISYLSITDTRHLKVLLPVLNLQLQFAQEVYQINKLKSDVQKSIDETQLLMDSLMQEYFG